MLIVMWLCAALRGVGPYPILVVTAEFGAAKSTLCRVCDRLIECDVRASACRTSSPRNAEDLMIAATNGHVVAYDNLSRLNG